MVTWAIIWGGIAVWGVIHWVRNERAYREWSRQRDISRGVTERQDSDH